MLPKIKEVDQLVIISDGDRYSWHDLNWKALEAQIPIKLKNISVEQRDLRNIYFKNIVASSNSSLMQKVGMLAWQEQMQKLVLNYF